MLTMDDMLAIVKPHNDKLIAEDRAEEAERRLAKVIAKNSDLRRALGQLLDSLPPDFPNRAYYDEITSGTDE